MSRLESALVAATLALLAGLVALDLSGHRLFVVVGSSMEPAVPRGALVVVRPVDPASLAAGDVITFERGGETVTHRIAAIDRGVITTRGDANQIADPDRIAFQDRAGLVVASLPLLGYPIGLAQSLVRPLALVLALAIAGRAALPALALPALPFLSPSSARPSR